MFEVSDEESRSEDADVLRACKVHGMDGRAQVEDPMRRDGWSDLGGHRWQTRVESSENMVTPAACRVTRRIARDAASNVLVEDLCFGAGLRRD